MIEDIKWVRLNKHFSNKSILGFKFKPYSIKIGQGLAVKIDGEWNPIIVNSSSEEFDYDAFLKGDLIKCQP